MTNATKQKPTTAEILAVFRQSLTAEEGRMVDLVSKEFTYQVLRQTKHSTGDPMTDLHHSFLLTMLALADPAQSAWLQAVEARERLVQAREAK